MRRPVPAIPVLLILSACAGNTSTYPSLARRPAERVIGTALPAAPDPRPGPVATSPEIASRLDAIVARARAADAQFAAREGATRRLIGLASGAAVASDAWSNATVGMAMLDSARSQTMIALADLDGLYAAARVNGEDSAQIGQARATVEALVERENAVLAGLRELAAPTEPAPTGNGAGFRLGKPAPTPG